MESQMSNYDLVILEAVIESIERQGSFQQACREVGLRREHETETAIKSVG